MQAKLETVTLRVPGAPGLVSPPGTLGRSHLIQGREYWGMCICVKKNNPGFNASLFSDSGHLKKRNTLWSFSV